MLFYQRDGFAKTAQYAGADWADGAAHTGKCYLYSDTTMTLNQDLHGGWWDAATSTSTPTGAPATSSS